MEKEIKKVLKKLREELVLYGWMNKEIIVLIKAIKPKRNKWAERSNRKIINSL